MDNNYRWESEFSTKTDIVWDPVRRTFDYYGIPVLIPKLVRKGNPPHLTEEEEEDDPLDDDLRKALKEWNEQEDQK